MNEDHNDATTILTSFRDCSCEGKGRGKSTNSWSWEISRSASKYVSKVLGFLESNVADNLGMLELTWEISVLA